MPRPRLSAALVALALLALARAQDNPLRSAKVGDYVESIITKTMPGAKMTQVVRQTVKAVSPKELTLTIEASADGQKVPPQEGRVAIDKPFDPSKPATPPGFRIQKLEEAKEEVVVHGKKYQCTRYKYRIALEQPNVNLASTTTVWLSKDVPLDGVVKMVTEDPGGVTTTVELQDSGRGK